MAAHITNPTGTPEQLFRRNSFSSLPPDLQDAVFFAAQCLTQAAGILLQLPQSTTAQANVLLARYWLVDPLMSHEFSDVSAACIYLVAKLGPSPRSPRDVSNVYAYLLSSNSSLFCYGGLAADDPMSYYQPDSEYQAFHSRILALEGRILYTLAFDTHVSLPHPLAITYLQALEFLSAPKEEIARRVVEYLNTALVSPQMLYLTHQPNALAVAAIYNAARDLGAKMPESEWWEVFDVDREDLGFLVVGMRSLEAWVRKMRSDLPAMKDGMVSRRTIDEELAKRDLHVGNGRGGAELDEEQEGAFKMDEQITEMEGHA